MKKILYISPHLDDVILSCGSTIAKQCQKGNLVTVATIFSSGNDKSNHSTRRENDTNAVKKIGASHKHLGYIDAPFRSEKYFSFSTLLYYHDYPAEISLLNDIIKSIIQVIKRDNFDKCYFPLGVGGHIDHNLAFYAGLNILDLNVCECLFYEDFPYNQIKNWNNIRKQQCSIQFDNSDKQHIKLREQNLPFVTNYFMDSRDETDSEIKYKQEIEVLLRLKTLPAFNIIQNCKEYDIENKLKALQDYQTEFEILIDELNFNSLKVEVNYKLIRN